MTTIEIVLAVLFALLWWRQSVNETLRQKRERNLLTRVMEIQKQVLTPETSSRLLMSSGFVVINRQDWETIVHSLHELAHKGPSVQEWLNRPGEK